MNKISSKTKSDSAFDGSRGMSPRKAMAGGGMSGNFGVMAFPKGAGEHPDHKSGLGEKGAMDDGERGIGGAIQHTKGMHPAQAAPDHGPDHPGGYQHFRREKMA